MALSQSISLIEAIPKGLKCVDPDFLREVLAGKRKATAECLIHAAGNCQLKDEVTLEPYCYVCSFFQGYPAHDDREALERAGITCPNVFHPFEGDYVAPFLLTPQATTDANHVFLIDRGFLRVFV